MKASTTPLPRSRLVLLVATCLLLIAACAGGPTRQAPAAIPPQGAALEQARFLLDQGQRYASEGDLVRAEQYLVSALEAGAPRKRVLSALLRVCVESRRYRVALQYVEDALGMDPYDSQLRFLAGSLQAATGDVTRAREQLTRAADELRTQPEVQYSVAVFSRDLGQDPSAADHYFRKYLDLAPLGPHAAEARNALLTKVE